MHHLFLFDLWYYVHGFIMEYQNLLVTLIIGAIAGLIAQMILPGRGFGMITTLVIGIIGCVVGNKLLAPYYKYLTHYKFLNHLICAIAATMVIALIVNVVRGGEDKDKTRWRHN